MNSLPEKEVSATGFKPLFSVPVIVAALGYFVDIYDLLLFSIVRMPSLRSLHVAETDLLPQGEFLINSQMTGLLVGGLIWGILGDKKGRLSVLFGSIILYSAANIANGFVSSVNEYALFRFIAGVGLAGELGAGITLVSEVLPVRLRGYGTALVASVGVLGAVLANFIAKHFDWQICYFIGGGLGLMLLIARVSVFESGIFLEIKQQSVKRGNFLSLFTNTQRLRKFFGCIFIGLPIWFTIGILVSFSPEFAEALGVTEPILAGNAIMFSYIGLSIGDMASGLISQMLKSRKKVVLIFILLTFASFCLYLFMPVRSSAFFYGCCFVMGISIGYWALFVTIAAEQFGTNLRSTVATSVPNFIRGTVVPLIFIFKFVRVRYTDLSHGKIYGAFWIGFSTIVIAIIALQFIDETFSRDLNFTEED
jgi:MFS transporter, putative metabolite:H+ symporter